MSTIIRCRTYNQWCNPTPELAILKTKAKLRDHLQVSTVITIFLQISKVHWLHLAFIPTALTTLKKPTSASIQQSLVLIDKDQTTHEATYRYKHLYKQSALVDTYLPMEGLPWLDMILPWSITSQWKCTYKQDLLYKWFLTTITVTPLDTPRLCLWVNQESRPKLRIQTAGDWMWKRWVLNRPECSFTSHLWTKYNPLDHNAIESHFIVRWKMSGQSSCGTTTHDMPTLEMNSWVETDTQL